MPTILGIESTAHTFGVGVVKNGKILSNRKRVFTTEKGGMIPIDVAEFHCENKNEIYFEALDNAGVKENDIDAIAFSQGPGLAPCLLEGMKFAKELAKKLKKPLVPVNHCVAHLEIGRITKAKDPVMLYASGANTQIIAYASGKYRVFGETLDIGIGNFIDTFGRYAKIGFPAGGLIEKLALKSKKYIELPYKVKGMDVAFSGILTNLRQKLEKLPAHSHSQIDNKQLIKKPNEGVSPRVNINDKKISLINNSNQSRAERGNVSVDYTLADLAYSMQETVFAMLVETAERALAHTGKKELLLGGGVACNTRLQKMCKIMCKERRAKLFVPSKDLLQDNGAMVAYVGEIMFNSGIKFVGKKIESVDIKPRQRTDNVDVGWR